jgi:hypothetical protein
MKHVVNSLFTAIQRTRTSEAQVEIHAGEQALGAPMIPLAETELRLVVGGDGNPGPHGSWGSNNTPI